MKRPAFQFYPGDWQRDAALRACSVGARGLWMEMICIMHQAQPYGHLVLNGTPIGAETLARMVGSTPRETVKWLAELEQNGVYNREDDAIVSRRMIRDEEIRKSRADGGKLGGNPALKDNHKVANKDNHQSNLQPTPSSSTSSSTSSSPLTSPKGEVSSASPPPCPHEQIIEIYERVLPELPGVAKWTPTRKGYLQARWREDKRHQSLEYWERFFNYVKESDFLCGRAKPKPGERPFRADLEWLITQGNFVKVLERKYENRGRE